MDTIEEVMSVLKSGKMIKLVRDGDTRNTHVFWSEEKQRLGHVTSGIDCCFGMSSILTETSVVERISDKLYEIVHPISLHSEWNRLHGDDLVLESLAQKVEEKCRIFIGAHFPLGLFIFYDFRFFDNKYHIRTGDAEYSDTDYTPYESVFDMWLALVEAIKCPNANITFEEYDGYELSNKED